MTNAANYTPETARAVLDVAAATLFGNDRPDIGDTKRGFQYHFWLGKTVAAIDRDTAGNVTIYSGSTPAGAAVRSPGLTISAYNRLDDLEEDLFVYLITINGLWEIIGAGCPIDPDPAQTIPGGS